VTITTAASHLAEEAGWTVEREWKCDLRRTSRRWSLA
jgi:hypothetical protein